MKNNQNIKVFISSTFRDLNIERDYIVKKIFPEIRSKLVDGITVSEVDLRWGITDQESREKRVVDLCLQYLYDSKPFFVGILGERYGSTISPDNVELSPLVNDAFPHVWDDLNEGLSITEIEILNGVLRAPKDKKPNAIFFIMDTDRPYEGEEQKHFEKLQSLKKRIMEQTDYPFYIYNNLEDLDKLEKFILDKLSEYSRQNTSHKNSIFFQNNLCFEHYRSMEPHNLAILDHLMPVLERAKPVAILQGMEGSGKSALVAQLGGNYKGSDRVFLHMYGNVPDCTANVSQFTSYFIDAARHKLKEKYDSITGQHNLRGWFKRTFQSVDLGNDFELLREATKHKWCIVLDNISSLRLKTISPMVYIIPAIKIGMDAFKKRGFDIDYRILLVQGSNSIYNSSNKDYEIFSMPLGCSMNSQVFIDSYLSIYSKHLNAKQKQMLQRSPLATHPRSLFLVCEYMRESVTHEQLSSFIEHVATFKSTEGLFRLFFERLKNQLPPDALRQLLGLISLFSYGLNLHILQKLSGLDNLSFYQAWSTIKKLVTEEPTGAIHWINAEIANIIDHEFNLKEESFRVNLAKKCYNYLFDILDKLFTPEKLVAEIRKSWWFWKSSLISSIPKEKQDKTRLEIFRMNDLVLYSYLSGKGCFKTEHIRNYVYPIAMQQKIASETEMALHRARKQGMSMESILSDGVAKFYKEGFWEFIARYRKPTQMELLCYLESLCICKNWKQLEVELANPEVLNYVYSTSVLLDCWNIGMNQGGISIIQPDMKTYDKMLEVSYSLRNEEGVKYYTN